MEIIKCLNCQERIEVKDLSENTMEKEKCFYCGSKLKNRYVLDKEVVK